MSDKNRTKYVIFGGGFEWMEFCYKDVKNNSNVLFVNSQIPYIGNNIIIKIFAKLCYGLKSSPHTYILPFFRKLLFKSFSQQDFLKDASEIVFIIYDQNRVDADFDFIDYLKKKYKERLHLVYCFTNTFERSHIQNNYGLGNRLHDYYDLIFSYNKDDCKAYGFSYYPLLFSFSSINNKDLPVVYDVVFVGNGKDRLHVLHSAYKYLYSNGCVCKFYIVGVPIEEQLNTNDIIYNQPISYDQNIELIKSSKCVFDVMQGGASGMNIRILESIFNGRKVITNCEAVKSEEGLKDRILVYREIEDIDISFIKDENFNIDYQKLSTYSPGNFIENIKQELRLVD